MTFFQVNVCVQTVHDQLHSYIIIYGGLLQPKKTFFVCEGSRVMEVGNLFEGLIALFATYYSSKYDISVHTRRSLCNTFKTIGFQLLDLRCASL